MLKATPTKGNEHWKCVIKGQAVVNTKEFGVPTMSLNPNDPEEMAKAIAKMAKGNNAKFGS